MRFAITGLVLVLGLSACKSIKQRATRRRHLRRRPSRRARRAQHSGRPQGVLAKVIPAPPDVATPPADAVKTASGLPPRRSSRQRHGNRPPARPGSRSRELHGLDEEQARSFDAAARLTQASFSATFGVGQVIPGWTEALQLMVAGEKRRVWIPPTLAYGEHPMGGAPAGALTFDVELLAIMKAPDPPAVPEDVSAAPKTAKKTKSGLAYRVLRPGTGAQPKATDTVLVHYSGWTTDGKMFDSSVMRGQPITFRLDQVIKGWTEGVQLMNVGEKARFWIPGNLAYGDKPTRPGAPAGMLVFDIELLGIWQ